MLSLFRGKKVIFPRGIHASAANGIFMFGITPVYLGSAPCDYPAVVRTEDIKTALKSHKDAAAVFVTYPNYFGLCCDIEAIAEAAHRVQIPLLVDAAHAAHFAYSPLLPLAPSYAGADIWTESAHKTLPAMNQCACLCVGKNARIDKNEAGRALAAIQTTSPSYLLLASLDYAYAYMRDKGEQELYRIIRLAERFGEMIDALPGFSCPEMDMPGVADRDCLKMAGRYQRHRIYRPRDEKPAGAAGHPCRDSRHEKHTAAANRRRYGSPSGSALRGTAAYR